MGPRRTSLDGRPLESIIGKTVKTEETGDSSFLVTGVSFDVSKGSYIAHLRRTDPPPLDFVNPIALSKMYEVTSPIRRGMQDGFALLVSRAVDISHPTA